MAAKKTKKTTPKRRKKLGKSKKLEPNKPLVTMNFGEIKSNY